MPLGKLVDNGRPGQTLYLDPGAIGALVRAQG